MKKKFILSMLGSVLLSLGAMAQTYKLTDMTEAEFENGYNTHFRFDQYRLASGVYSPFAVFTDQGRVNFFDRYWPEYFQGTFVGGNVVDVGGNRDYTTPLRNSWSAEEVAVDAALSTHPAPFIYVSRIDDTTFETYPTLIGTAAICFEAPADGYYKITTSLMRMDQMGTGTPEYIMAKYRFRQQGAPVVFSSSSLGMDVKYGDMSEEDLPTFTALSGVNFDGAERTYTMTKPVTHEFFVHIKAGDMITAEADVSHMYGQDKFIDSTNYVIREAWARTRWTQFDAEVVTQEVAEGSGRFVDPYSANDEYITLFQNLFIECSAFAEASEVGVNIGQFQEEDLNAFWDLLYDYGVAAQDPNLLGYTAKVYYERLQEEFEAFKSKAYTVDFQLPENRWLFVIPEKSTLYADFEAQFLPKDHPDKAEDSPWDFKTYTVASGIYDSFLYFGTESKGGETLGFYNGTGSNDWLYILKNGNVHPTTAVSPAITFTAAKDGLYHASTTVQRGTTANRNYMHTRYRYIKGGIEDGLTSVPKENFMFSDAYGNSDQGNPPVSRDFYVNLKKGDVITFEEDCYTTGSNGSGGTTWEKLMVLLIPEDQVQTIIEENPDLYFDPYATASDFAEMDALLNKVETFLASVEHKISEDPALGEYPEAAKWEMDDALAMAQELRNNPETTQVDLNAGVLTLSNEYAKFIASQVYRYESPETFTNGAYHIEKDGLFLTVDGFFSSGATNPQMYAHFEPMIDNSVKNNQVFNVQFNDTPGFDEPLRYTLTSCLADETWVDDGPYHITEKGEIRLGDTQEAQSSNSDNHIWRNHSLLYNGEHWAIFNVRNNWSIVFNDDLESYPTMVTTREYLYKLIPFGTPGVGVENVTDDAQSSLQVWNIENGIQLSSSQPVEASVYNATGQLITTVKLSTTAIHVALPAGFYVVKSSHGSTSKVMVK